jgi:hypothetical protein
MKAGLKRIEATLHDLVSRGTGTEEISSTNKQSPSFRISTPSTEEAPATDKPLVEVETSPSDAKSHNFIHQLPGQGFSRENEECNVPNLPKFKLPNFTNHRNGANPALATNLLKEIYDIVAGWQVELQQVLKQIQDIYLEGPIVNGWLESHPSPAATEEHDPTPEEPSLTATLRHCEVDQLMSYVEEICAAQPKAPKQAAVRETLPWNDRATATSTQGTARVERLSSNFVSKAVAPEYNLCGLDSAGQIWTRPCPPEQVASVSMAIARYQKLRQFLARKQYLETRLSQLAETLILLHSHIQAE